MLKTFSTDMLFVEITTIVANFKPYSFSVFGTVSSQFIVYKNPHTYTLRGPKLMIDIFLKNSVNDQTPRYSFIGVFI